MVLLAPAAAAAAAAFNRRRRAHDGWWRGRLGRLGEGGGKKLAPESPALVVWCVGYVLGTWGGKRGRGRKHAPARPSRPGRNRLSIDAPSFLLVQPPARPLTPLACLNCGSMGRGNASGVLVGLYVFAASTGSGLGLLKGTVPLGPSPFAKKIADAAAHGVGDTLGARKRVCGAEFGEYWDRLQGWLELLDRVELLCRGMQSKRSEGNRGPVARSQSAHLYSYRNEPEEPAVHCKRLRVCFSLYSG